ETIIPIIQSRLDIRKTLTEKELGSKLTYFETLQQLVEQQEELAVQKSRLKEAEAAVAAVRETRSQATAEYRRSLSEERAKAEQKANGLAQDLIKAEQKIRLQLLTAPVDGTVQQLAVHTVGGVVTPAQALMVIAPSDYQAEVEATLENKDVGFVKVGQRAEVKVETFPFTRYGTLGGTVSFVSNDAVNDEKRGPIFQARVKLDTAKIRVDERDVTLTPGMAVSAEISTGTRRVIEFFLDPIRKTTSEGLRER